jgi:serine/threonine-protein kinase
MNSQPDADSLNDLNGRAVGGYLVLRRIGSGGMADVYLADQRSLDRLVALKVLHPRLAGDRNYVQRFLNEARAAASLVHPSIVQIYEVGQADGVHYIAQEFVAGKSLDQILDKQGPVEPGTVLEIMRQVTSGLCKAAELGIVHRDIKPANILFSPSGAIKVADFGLARVQHVDSHTLTQVGMAMGTPLYMSPEQIEGRPVDARSDIYSLGATCYHLLSGEPPHSGETALAIALQHLNKQPVPLDNLRPGLAEGLVRLVHRMMAKEPADRFEGPQELLVELKELAQAGARDGWALGPEHWSLVEWLSTDESRSAASTQLGEVLRRQTQLLVPRWSGRRWGWRLLLGLVCGAVLGLVLRPQFLLQGSRWSPIPKRDTPEAQLFHAKMNEGSEAAWRAVWEYFPEADAYLKQLAKQGLVRYYLFDAQDYHKALPIVEQLAEQSEADPQGESSALRAFALAAECICRQCLGQAREASEVQAKLTSDMRDVLRNTDSQLYELLQRSTSPE